MFKYHMTIFHSIFNSPPPFFINLLKSFPLLNYQFLGFVTAMFTKISQVYFI